MTMTCIANTNRSSKEPRIVSIIITALLAFSVAVRSQESSLSSSESEYQINADNANSIIDYGNHNSEWEDGPSSWNKFGHDNDPAMCGLSVLTVEEWEAGKYWDGNKPVLVRNVTDGWAALENWKK